MPTYEQVLNAGNIDGQNVFRVRFATNPCSDIPQLQAWDDFNANSVIGEQLAGTPGNGNKPLVAAKHTTGGPSGAAWVPASATPGGATTNRLKGGESFCLLGATPPAANEDRTFQLALGCAADSAQGTSGHLPILLVKTFYAGAPPDVSFWYNNASGGGTEVTPAWVQMTSEDQGVSMPIGVKNTIHATGPATTTSALDPVTKPGSGEKWAEEQWIMTAA